MSRTDVHRPWRVQVADPHNRHLLYRYPMWPWQMALTPFRNLFCGCRLLAEVDREDLDVPPPPYGTAW